MFSREYSGFWLRRSGLWSGSGAYSERVMQFLWGRVSFDSEMEMVTIFTLQSCLEETTANGFSQMASISLNLLLEWIYISVSIEQRLTRGEYPPHQSCRWMLWIKLIKTINSFWARIAKWSVQDHPVRNSHFAWEKTDTQRILASFITLVVAN